MTHVDLSIIVPTYNSIEKMDATLHSLRELSELVSVEVVFVDDCSKDETYAELLKACNSQPMWRVFRLEKNSGSAAAPRNRGIEESTGEYFFFLDSDDVIEPHSIHELLSLAQRDNHDVVRSALKVRMGDGTERIGDLIPGWDQIKDRVSKVRAITRYQSLTCSFLMKREILVDNGIRFDPTRRIGEDIKFTSEVLLSADRIGYRDLPSRTYVRSSVGEESVTQSLNSDQFEDFVLSWDDVENNLSEIGVSFVTEHGFAAIQYALRQFVWFKSENLGESTFFKFSDFCRDHEEEVREFKFPPRYREIINAALEGDFEGFTNAVQLRVLIAGHDLKFMEPIQSRMAQKYSVRIDQWQGHTQHDEESSKSDLQWADFVWVEWLLGAAVWYSQRVRSDQRLVIRAHRSEVTADYGVKIDLNRVAAIISIAPHVLGDIADRFDIPRDKMWLIPNALEVENYNLGSYDDPARLKKIAIVGTVPRLKGYLRAVELLKLLRAEFPDLELHTYGKRPEELEWVWRNETEAEYYRTVEELVASAGLSDAVIEHGWVQTEEALSEVAAVVSLSDYEGMQVSVAEGFCAGGVGVTLNWRGADQGYPSEWVAESVGEMADKLRPILDGTRDLETASEDGRDLIRSLYSADHVWKKIDSMMKAVRA